MPEAKEKKGATWPAIVKDGQRRERKNWGSLSRAAAWKAPCFLEETKGDAEVFLEKGGEKRR